MADTSRLKDVRIQSREDVRKAAEAFRDIANEMMPCRIAATHNIAVRQLMIDGDGDVLATEVFGWTTEDRWWRVPQLALASPMPQACRFEAEPFWVSEAGFRTRCPNEWIGKIDLTDFEKRAFTRAAIVVPVHLPFGQIGAVSFNPNDRAKVDLSEEYEAYSDVLGMYSRVFISSYQRTMVKPERLPVTGSQLSKREVECLRWAAIGKTDHEIALILKRSRATIRFHIHNAATKLDALNRSQTVFKAAQLGFIGLNS